MKRGTKLIILGLLMFLAGISLIQLSVFSREEVVGRKQTLDEYETNVPPSIGIFLELPTTCGVSLTGPFLNYTDQPVVEVINPQGQPVYGNYSFPPPSLIEFDITVPGLYIIRLNIDFGEGSIVEVYYYDYELAFVRPYEGLFYPGVVFGGLGIAASATGMFMPSKKSEKGE